MASEPINSVLRWIPVLALVAAAGCNEDDSPGPRIDLLAPPQARIGDVIDILGERFCGPEVEPPAPGPIDAGIIDAGMVIDAAVPRADDPCANGFVTFGPLDGIPAADVEEWTPTRITVRVPQIGPGPTGVVVTVNGRQSEVADFQVIQ